MTQNVQVANTNIEFEMAHSKRKSLELSLSAHPYFIQLQFLPLLYAESNEIVAVTALPPQEFLDALNTSEWFPCGLPQLALLAEISPFLGKNCLSWGPSRQVEEWAKERQMQYLCPKWEVSQHINSKAFSSHYCALPGAELIWNENELKKWMQRIKGPKVLKSCFGVSGKGNWLLNNEIISQELLSFCQKEWEHQRPMIAEPWVDRVLDFSTQWFIHPSQIIEYVGATRFETDQKGIYQSTLAGPESILFHSIESFLEKHREVAMQALTEAAKMGFFGFVGIDALVYRQTEKQNLCLYPIVEINGRQTMSLVALRLQRKICPDKSIKMSYAHEEKNQFGLLPSHLGNAKGKTIKFFKNLYVSCDRPCHDQSHLE